MATCAFWGIAHVKPFPGYSDPEYAGPSFRQGSLGLRDRRVMTPLENF